MNRRGFLQSILAAGVAPYVVTAAGVLMPVRKIAVPELVFELNEAFRLIQSRPAAPDFDLRLYKNFRLILSLHPGGAYCTSRI